MLWCCWLGDRKGIRPVKKLSGGVLGWLSVWRCRLAYGPADVTATHWLVLPFWYRLTQVVLEKRPLNVCVCVCALLTMYELVLCQMKPDFSTDYVVNTEMNLLRYAAYNSIHCSIYSAVIFCWCANVNRKYRVAKKSGTCTFCNRYFLECGFIGTDPQGTSVLLY